MRVCSVYLLDTTLDFDKVYAYSVPDELADSVRVGCLVVVPFGGGNRRKSAFVVSVCDDAESVGESAGKSAGEGAGEDVGESAGKDVGGGAGAKAAFKVELKPVLSVPDYPLPNPDEARALASFVSERCFCTFGAALKLLLPVGINLRSTTYYVALPSDSDDELYRFVSAKERASDTDILRSFGAEGLKLAASLCRRGLLRRCSEVREKANVKTELWVKTLWRKDEPKDDEPKDDEPKDDEQKDGEPDKEKAGRREADRREADRSAPRGVRQKLLLKLLSGGDMSLKQLKENGVSPATVRVMEGKGCVAIYEKRLQRFPYAPESYPKKPYLLSEKQRAVRDEVAAYMRSGRAEACLLYGVTGSGKTKIIVEAVKEALRQKRSAIVLLPEIGLTAQAVSLYFSEFGNECAVLHSRLSAGERADTYARIAAGEVKVVLGTRSAVFAPLSDIGVIAIDEEQEHTYKSDKTPKYHARDVARFRCAYHKALMLLCSATPSVESFYKAQTGRYKLLELDERYGGTQLPEVLIEDLVGDREAEKGRLIGRKLKEALFETVKNGEQAILFLGRRGYNSALRCRSCGHVFTCPRCSVSLNYHAYSREKSRRGKLVCHYCGHIEDRPVKCPECGGTHIGYFGYGTQLLQDELEELFGEGAALRMDTDTTTGRRSHDEILREFENGEASILYGTQMVVKGLDFPNVSLVGLVMADSVLYMNDYRAPERMFSLITQLVGRSGRSNKRGKAIVQTYNPLHQTLILGAKQDYKAFYESEIRLRKSVLFPPFCSIAVFGFSAVDEGAVIEAAEAFSGLFERKADENPRIKVIKMGPFREGIYMLGGRYRCKIIVKYRESKECRAFFRALLCEFRPPKKGGASFDIDINPTIV